MDLNFEFFKIDKEHMMPEKGKLLISEPFLQDTYFKRSIILLTEHNEDGSAGFVLNKPTRLGVNEVLEDFPKIDSDISIGGPVANNTIHFCHTLGDVIPKSVKVTGDIYWGGDFDTLKDLIRAGVIDNKQVRFFIGYSGWSPHQLEGEIKENSWIVADILSSAIIHNADKDSWRELLSRLGRKYKVWASYPENPVMN